MAVFYRRVTGYIEFLLKLLHVWSPTIFLDCSLWEETTMLIIIGCYKEIPRNQDADWWQLQCVRVSYSISCLNFCLRDMVLKISFGGLMRKDGQSSLYTFCWNGTIDPVCWELWNSCPILPSGCGGGIPETGMDTGCHKMLASYSLRIGWKL